MNNIKILYFDRISILKGIDVNKTSAPKKGDICHYCYFLSKEFKVQCYVCNRCHDLLMMSFELSDIAILKVKSFDCQSIITGISKIKAIKLLQNIDVTAKSRKLSKNGKLEIENM